MRLIQDKHYSKMKPTIHIGLSNAKFQDRTRQLFKSKLLHEITVTTYTNNSSQSSNGRLDSDVVTKSNAKQKNKEADQQILL
jgi:hypothetical protein